MGDYVYMKNNPGVDIYDEKKVQYIPSQDIAFQMSNNPSVDNEILLKKFLNQRENNVLPIENIKNYFKILLKLIKLEDI